MYTGTQGVCQRDVQRDVEWGGWDGIKKGGAEEPPLEPGPRRGGEGTGHHSAVFL